MALHPATIAVAQGMVFVLKTTIQFSIRHLT
jgi:hypothetical protein